MCLGSTQDIKARLQEEGLLDELMEKVTRLIKNIEYEERHPWG